MDACIERDVIRDLFRQVDCRGRQLWDHVSLSLALPFFLLPRLLLPSSFLAAALPISFFTRFHHQRQICSPSEALTSILLRKISFPLSWSSSFDSTSALCTPLYFLAISLAIFFSLYLIFCIRLTLIAPFYLVSVPFSLPLSLHSLDNWLSPALSHCSICRFLSPSIALALGVFFLSLIFCLSEFSLCIQLPLSLSLSLSFLYPSYSLSLSRSSVLSLSLSRKPLSISLRVFSI